MSAGTKVYPVRLADDLVSEINAAIKSRNHHSAKEPWTFSEFVRDAIKAKLDHIKRSRKQQKLHMLEKEVFHIVKKNTQEQGGAK